MKKPEGYDEMLARNKEAMKKHWEDFQKSDEYLIKPYMPLLICPGIVGIDFDEEEEKGG